jgi:hypothetical protein
MKNYKREQRRRKRREGSEREGELIHGNPLIPGNINP